MAEGSKEITVSKGKPERALHMMAPFEDVEHWFDAFWRNPLRPFANWPRALTGMALGPNVDVIDQDDELVVRAEVPGFHKEDIEVWTSGPMLTIRGTKKSEEREQKADYYRAEISHASFSRTIPLPAEVNESGAKATLKDGMLELKLPKVAKSRRHAIRID